MVNAKPETRCQWDGSGHSALPPPPEPPHGDILPLACQPVLTWALIPHLDTPWTLALHTVHPKHLLIVEGQKHVRVCCHMRGVHFSDLDSSPAPRQHFCRNLLIPLPRGCRSVAPRCFCPASRFFGAST